MSRYLIDRITSQPNIEVLTQTEVSGLEGEGGVLETIRWRNVASKTETARRIRHHLFHKAVIELVCEPHRENCATLGKRLGRELGRALRDQSEGNTILAAFASNPSDRPRGRSKPDALVGRDVAVRFLAYQKNRWHSPAIRPYSEIEHEPAG